MKEKQRKYIYCCSFFIFSTFSLLRFRLVTLFRVLDNEGLYTESIMLGSRRCVADYVRIRAARAAPLFSFPFGARSFQ